MRRISIDCMDSRTEGIIHMRMRNEGNADYLRLRNKENPDSMRLRNK